jgi:low temperature requirement protein LtrA
VNRYHRGPDQTGTTMLELFYDLVFVFAITQVSHLLLDHLDWEGVGQSVVTLLVVWWSWNYTTWVTNELDPNSVVVRLLLIAMMLGSLLMAVAIPDAFGDKALLFAGSYVAISVVRHGFLAFVACGRGTLERMRAELVLIWLSAAGVLWIAGALAGGTAQVVLWILALLIDYTGPAVTYRVPGLARTRPQDWDVGTEHFSERFQLFVIIALGESIVITGATTAESSLDTATIAAFALAFLGSAALWWLYFNVVATIVARRMELAENRTVVARDAYTYLHVLIIAGIVVSAVGDEVVIAHPTEVLHGPELAVVVAGPALYLLAHVALRWRMTHSLTGRRLAGALACIPVYFIGTIAPALVVLALLVGILVAIIVGDQVETRRREARGEPSPIARLTDAPTETR